LASALDPDASEIQLEASRSARAADLAPLGVGQSVPVAVKRVHVLPTPIGSLRVLAPTAAKSRQLRSSPLIRELADRMHVTPVDRVLGDRLPPDVAGGTPVIALASQGGLSACARLLDQGAGQVLGVRDGDQRVGRLLIYIQPTRAAREAALGAAATLLRHLAVDA